MERIYLIKNPSNWMIDELLVFSQYAKFKVIFIRKPGDFYLERLDELKNNGIEIECEPFTNSFNLQKLFFCIGFILKNLSGFSSWYSFVVGIKSLWWFFRLKETYFENPVSIHAQFATQPTLISLLLKKYYTKKKIDYYFTFHAYDIFFDNKWFVKLVNNSNKSFSISQYNISYVLDKYKNLDKSKLEISRLGAFTNNSSSLNINNTKSFNIGFISWFVEKKGIKYLLEAIKVLVKTNKNIKLTIAGDGPLRNEIEQFIIKNNLSDFIYYIGKINESEKVKFFSSIDTLVLPAITLPDDKDGIPVVLMEAISYGLPIISTNVSGIPEICIDNYNGYLIPERDVDSLVVAINSLATSKELRYKFSENSLLLFNDYKIENNSLTKLQKLDWI